MRGRGRLWLFSSFALLVLVASIAYALPRGTGYDVKSAVDSCLSQLKERMETAKGRVVAIRGSSVVVVFDSPWGLHRNQELLVTRSGPSIKDPETGKVYPGFPVNVAVIRIENLSGSRAQARVEKSWEAVKMGYRVVPPFEPWVVLEPASVDPELAKNDELTPEEIDSFVKIAVGQDPAFHLGTLPLPEREYGFRLHPVVRMGVQGPEMAFEVLSAYAPSSSPTMVVSKVIPVVQTASYAVLGKRKKLIESGEWGGYTSTLASRVLKGEIRSVACGDVNGDGKVDIVTLSSKGWVRVFDLHEKEFKEILSYRLRVGGGEHHRFLTVHLADLNKNGREEIFVTHVREDLISGVLKPSLDSQVLEVDRSGKKIKVLAKRQPYYFRVVRNSLHPEGMVLAQQMGEYEPYKGGIKRVTWHGKKLAFDDRLPPFMKKVERVYGFIWEDLNGDGKMEVALIDDDGFLSVMNLKGDLLWESPDSLGPVDYNFFYQTPRFIRIVAEKNFEPESVAKKRAIPRRLLVRYLKGDGRMAIFTVMNDTPSFVVAGVYIESSWHGMNGRVVKIEQVGTGQVSAAYFDILWETPKFADFYGEDLAIADFNGDGALDVLLLGRSKRAKKSRLDIYPIPGA